MPYIIIEGSKLDSVKGEALASQLTDEVASLFNTPKSTVLAVVHGGEELVVLAAGQKRRVTLDITVEGAGVGESAIPQVVQRLTDAAVKATGRPAEEVMVLVKIPGGPHMKMTDKCAGIGGRLLG
ncbi:MAG: hypothetical protein HYU86_07075 [Chloroflexi bacterium]|nr:hypothetical protein [Chloroflexota bacterium]